MVVQVGLAGSSAIVARQERWPCRASEYHGPGDFLQAPRIATRGFDSLKPSSMTHPRGARRTPESQDLRIFSRPRIYAPKRIRRVELCNNECKTGSEKGA